MLLVRPHLLPACRRLGVLVAHIVDKDGAVVRGGHQQLLVPGGLQPVDLLLVALDLLELACGVE